MAGPKLNWRSWFKSLVEPPHGVADSLIARGTVLTGDLAFSGVLYLAGEVRGHVDGAPGAMLVLMEDGVVAGNVRCPFVVVAGTVKGDVDGEGHVHLEATARIEGQVYYRLLEMHAGAQVAGHVVRRDERHAPPREPSELPLVKPTADNS